MSRISEEKLKLKQFKVFLREVNAKSNKEISVTLNHWYVNNKESATEQMLLLLKTNLYKNIKRQFKEGVNIKGALEHEYIEKDLSLKVLRGKWARRRGLHFEKIIVKVFNSYFTENNIACYSNLNYVSPFLYQPYDVCIFVKSKPPILLECKAAGVSTVNSKTAIKACNRRYLRAFANKDNIKRSIEDLKTPYYYVYGDFQNNKFYIVNARHVLSNLPLLYTRKVELKDTEYLHLDLDPSTWSSDVIEKIYDLV